MSNPIKTQGQAITLITTLYNVVEACNDTNSAQIVNVEALFKLVLGHAAPAVSSSTALKIVSAFRKAALFYSGVSAETQYHVDIIGSALLGVTVAATQAQAQAVFQYISDAYKSVADEPGHQILAANNLANSLLAL